MAELRSISTTLPVTTGTLPLPILTERLIIRPFRDTELYQLHTLIIESEPTQSETYDISHTRTELLRHLPPYKSHTIWLGIFLKTHKGEEGPLIGDGGTHSTIAHCDTHHWPKFGYRFRQSYWQRGFGMEFATAFIEFWWSLPRETVMLKVDIGTLYVDQEDTAAEMIYAETSKINSQSKKLLEQVGFTVLSSDLDDESSPHKETFENSTDYWILVMKKSDMKVTHTSISRSVSAPSLTGINTLLTQ